MMMTRSVLILTTILCFASLLAADEVYLSIPNTFGIAKERSGDLKQVRQEVYGVERKIFDISHRYTPEIPVWESSEGLGNILRLALSMKNGSEANSSEMKLSVHSAPGHFHDKYYDAGFDSDSLDLDVLNAEVMESLDIPRGVRRVIFRTLNTDRRLMFKKEFDSSFVGLIENTDIKLVGLDYLSFAAYDEAPETHKIILQERDVEALKLDDVEVGVYSLHCLPLRLFGAEGAPARCILIK